MIPENSYHLVNRWAALHIVKADPKVVCNAATGIFGLKFHPCTNLNDTRKVIDYLNPEQLQYWWHRLQQLTIEDMEQYGGEGEAANSPAPRRMLAVIQVFFRNMPIDEALEVITKLQ